MPSPDLLEEVWDSLDGGSDEGAEVDVASDVALDEGPPPPAGNWAKNFGSSGAEEIKAVAADSQGNVYVAGYFQETLTIGSETFVPIEPETPDSFVASFDRYGEFRWAHAFGASQADMPFEIEVDGYDKIYVAGSHKATMTVGSEELVCNGSSDLYVVSYDADGNQLWAKSWGGDNSETPRDVSVNPAGDIFVTGSFQGSITADDITATGGGYNAYVLAIDAETHNALWITTFTGGAAPGKNQTCVASLGSQRNGRPSNAAAAATSEGFDRRRLEVLNQLDPDFDRVRNVTAHPRRRPTDCNGPL